MEERQIQQTTGNKNQNFWIWLTIGLIFIVLVVGVLYFSVFFIKGEINFFTKNKTNIEEMDQQNMTLMDIDQGTEQTGQPYFMIQSNLSQGIASSTIEELFVTIRNSVNEHLEL